MKEKEKKHLWKPRGERERERELEGPALSTALS
jgi:hypothetical protein